MTKKTLSGLLALWALCAAALVATATARPVPAPEVASPSAARTQQNAQQDAQQDAQEHPALDVMSFNIRYGTARDGDNRWELRREAVIETIEAHAPHVLGVQEALHFQLEELVAAMPRYQRLGVGRDDGREAGEYSAILVDTGRLDVIESGTFWFSDTPDVPGSTSWGNTITRICTWARLRDREIERETYVFNVHWDHRSQPSRERSAELLLDRIINRLSAAIPDIVTGDFNAGEQNPAFTALVSPVGTSPVGISPVGISPAPSEPQSASPAPLRDTFRALHPDATGVGTFNGFEGATDGDKIDAVLVSPEWEVLAAEIVRDAPGGRYPSDHFPVTARVRLR